jgi:hypothetical protein
MRKSIRKSTHALSVGGMRCALGLAATAILLLALSGAALAEPTFSFDTTPGMREPTTRLTLNALEPADARRIFQGAQITILAPGSFCSSRPSQPTKLTGN